MLRPIGFGGPNFPLGGGGPRGTPPPEGDGDGNEKKTGRTSAQDSFALSAETTIALTKLEEELADPDALPGILRDSRRRALLNLLPTNAQIAVAIRLQTMLETQLCDATAELSRDPTVLFLVSLLGVSVRKKLREALGLPAEDPIGYDEKGRPTYLP